MELSQAYREKTEAKIEQLDADLAKLEAKAKEVDADTQIKLNEKVQQLQKQKSELAHKYEALKKSSSDASQEIKEGFEKAWDDLSSSLSAAKDEFNKKD